MAFPVFDPSKHPRGFHGHFGAGKVDRKKYPGAVQRGRMGFDVGKRKTTLLEHGPIHYQEGPWFQKTGMVTTRSRFKGGKKSTTRFNVTAGRRTADGRIEAVTVPKLKQYWPKSR